MTRGSPQTEPSSIRLLPADERFARNRRIRAGDTPAEPRYEALRLQRRAEEDAMAERTKARKQATGQATLIGEPEQALAEVADELAALDPDEVLRVNVDVSRSVSIVLGAEPQIASYVEQIREELPKHDVSRMARLRTYALAALYANLTSQPPAKRVEVPALVERGASLKQRLILSAEAFAHAELVDGAQLAQIKTGTGHLDLATDLIALSALFRRSWEQVQGKTLITREDLEEATRIGTALLGALGAKDNAAVRAAPELTERKHRAFTLLVRAYNDARRALMYLRFDMDDVDVIAPSLYKKGRKRTAAVEESGEEVSGDDAETAAGGDTDAEAAAGSSAAATLSN